MVCQGYARNILDEIVKLEKDSKSNFEVNIIDVLV